MVLKMFHQNRCFGDLAGVCDLVPTATGPLALAQDGGQEQQQQQSDSKVQWAGAVLVLKKYPF
jgi:hypothetical protein